MYCIFFFFKQKTAYEMRISDWSSDVCSSDLTDLGDLVFANFVRHRVAMSFDLIAAFLQSTRAAIAPGERHDRIAITVGDEDGGLSPGWLGFGLQGFMQRDLRRQANQPSQTFRQAQRSEGGRVGKEGVGR